MFGIPEQHVNQMVDVGDELIERPCLSLIEEAGELIEALAKFNNDRIDHLIGRSHIIEEMTHVLVSMNLVCRRYGITENDIKKEVLAKAAKADFDTTNYIW